MKTQAGRVKPISLSNRLMVRATDLNTRLVLAGLLREADSPCRRLFLDYHGLKILGGWMAELGWAAARELELKEKVDNLVS